MGSIIDIITLENSDIKIIKNYKNADFRGSNIKLFSDVELKEKEICFSPVEILVLHSEKNVLRGLHYQEVEEQSRLLTCLSGKIFVAMLKIPYDENDEVSHWTYILQNDGESIYIPTGYAVGTYAIEKSDYLCLCGENPYNPKLSRGVLWNDYTLGIKWPVDGGPLISEKDSMWPSYKLLFGH